MPSDDDSSKNPFVRFKEHVDAHVAAGFQSALRFPATLTDLLIATVAIPRPASRATTTIYNGERGDANAGDYNIYGHAYDGEVSPDFRLIHRIFQLRRQEEALDEYFVRMGARYTGDEHRVLRDLLLVDRHEVFAERSAYSPKHLNKSVRAPTPRDIRDDMDPAMFTWIDAFEDLLVETAGRPLTDIRALYERNRKLREQYPQGEPTWSWLRRLWQLPTCRSYFDPDTFYEARNQKAQLKRPVIEQRTASGEGDRTVDRESLWDNRGLSGNEERRPGNGLFAEIERVTNALNQVLEDAIDGPRKRQTDSTREPRTENDLYEAVQSAFNEGQRSLAGFFKSLASEIEPRRPSGIKAEQADLPNGETVEEDGTKTVKSTREYVDDYGNKHINTEIRRLNKDGSIVSTETHYSVRPATEAERSSIQQSPQQRFPSGNGEHGEKDDKLEGDKQRSWFWK